MIQHRPERLAKIAKEMVIPGRDMVPRPSLNKRLSRAYAIPGNCGTVQSFIILHDFFPVFTHIPIFDTANSR